MVSITLPDNYGFAHGVVVGNYRKACGIKYPHTYASQEECKKSRQKSKIKFQLLLNCLIQPAAYKFNCAQRAHANFLENAPQTMLMALVAGLRFPQTAAVLTASWVVLRLLFLHGYVMSDKPDGNGRYRGILFWLAQGGLWGLSVFGVALNLGS
uniref:Glutation S-transferase n=1 Tax=Paracoccidioides brasiliensis TaxID=121759 RepID=Q5K5Z8_PARBR|nr:glutation S-transferase [Paracoccidioides brasiliensis]